MATLYRFTDENGNSVHLEQMPIARGEIEVIENEKNCRTLLASHSLKGLTENP